MKLFELKSYPRSIMPQIHAKDLKGKYDFIKTKVNIKDIIPVQKERLKKEYLDAVEKIKNNCAKPIVVDKHGKIVNGHHRHDAYKDLGYDKIKVIVVNATVEDLIKAFTEEVGGAGAGGGAAGGSGAGASAGGDGGSTSSSGDGGSADSGDTGSSDSAPTSDAPVSRGFIGLGSISPYKSKSKKKKKKKSNFQFGKGIYKEGDLLINLGLLESTPNFDFEWDEARRYPEFEKLGKEVWIEMAKRGKEVEITSAKDINNTDAANPENFYELEPEKQKRAMQALSRGKMEMPIVAQYSDGHKELIGGNTRLTYAMLRQGKAKIWIFNVPDSIAENATLWKQFDYKLGYRANLQGWLLQQNYNLRKAGKNEIPKIKADDAFIKAMMAAGVKPELITKARDVDSERRKEADDMWAQSWRAGNNKQGIKVERKKYGKGIFETIEAMQDLQALLKAIDEGDVIDAKDRFGKPAPIIKVMAKLTLPNKQTDWFPAYSGKDMEFAKDKANRLINPIQKNVAPLAPEDVKISVDGKYIAVPELEITENFADDGDEGNWEYFMQQLKASGWPQNRTPNADVDAKLVDLLNDPKAGKEHKEQIRKYFNFLGGFDIAIPGDVIDQEQLGKVTVLKIIDKDLYNMPAEYLVKTQKGSTLPITFDELVLGLEYGSETDIDSSKLMNSVYENFADGKKKGKSRPGRVKRAGASCKGSVTDLRAKAKKYSGERGKMYHWCANMKGGKKKK